MLATDVAVALVRIVHIATGVALTVGGMLGPPTPATGTRIGALQHRRVVAERLRSSLALLAVMAMASSRYI